MPIHLHLVVRAIGFGAAATRVPWHVLVVFADLAHDIVEGIVDVDARLRRGLDEFAAESARELFALCITVLELACCAQIRYKVQEGDTITALAHGEHVATLAHRHDQSARTRARSVWPTFCAHLPLALQIALVAHDDDGEVVLVLDAQYLLLECDHLLEALPRRYAVDQQEAFTRPHVLLSHRGVLFLAGRVEHVQERYLVVDDALLAVWVCDCNVSSSTAGQRDTKSVLRSGE